MYRDDLQTWKTADFCQTQQTMAPIIIDIVLDTKDLSSRQALMMRDALGKWNTVDSNKGRRRAITLERWTIDIERLPCPDAPDPTRYLQKGYCAISIALYADTPSAGVEAAEAITQIVCYKLISQDQSADSTGPCQDKL